ncbi:hypothetical protein MBM_03023 [Drepanopeziza brunnea f. sp. 'multigermtubi' MB_m1]|uniref:Serine hydrolase domain-containing protein n=1 Tax=Marssonina brunnea f. sp. multigermtubi (strain MB_m1) TaxID=1072389 RepID=K1X0R8_MARBU|nr:uncharacterized protein MBM_03023 [Drepanopeziza brunnea f. sp. 'multigermtubi' MB_m1]EKD18781.1 hypothetical protein MBM_03023 [Drepanopeziza brunnea f. sp. 'multigermtubi' MB_m1]
MTKSCSKQQQLRISEICLKLLEPEHLYYYQVTKQEAQKMSKLRVLCLHGFTSNGSVHAHQVRGITKPLSASFEFIFPDGPHEVPISDKMKQESPSMRTWAEYVSINSKSGHRAWWVAKDPDSTKNEPGGFDGLERSLDYLGDIIQKSGPVHAIWGFSQGACFSGMLMALLSPQQKNHPLRKRLPKSQGIPSAGIFFSGFKSRFAEHESAYEKGIEVPTLHVVGERDTAVTPEKSKTLARICKDAKVLTHAGAHDIPSSEEDRETVVRFMRENVRAAKSDGRENL